MSWLNKLQLSSEGWVKVVKGAAIAGGATFLTYLSQNITGADFGVYGPVIVGALSIGINYLKKLIEEGQNGAD